MLKKITITALTLFVFVFFDDSIASFVNSYLVGFNYSSSYSKVLFAFLNLLAVIYIYTRMKIFNREYFLNSILISFIYLCLRINIIPHAEWGFATLYKNAFYADAIFIFPFILLKPLIEQRLLKTNNSVPEKSNISDNAPIEKEKDDKFGYTKDAKNLLKRIIDNKQQAKNGALVIGLQGEWGKGKTSYLNMMKIAAKNSKNKVIMVRFNPWLNHGYNQLVQNFLCAISDEIDDITIKNTIHNYAQLIADADISYLSKVTTILKGNNNEYADELFDKVSTQIGKLNKLLIIQVDDIDRLTTEEVFNVLKLIRNVGNFKNTVFIIAYDAEYIKLSLEQMHINDKYLEKIFNINYFLPSIRKDEQIEIIKNTLITALLIRDEQKHIIDQFIEVINNDLSLRNAKKLAATIQNNWSNLLDADGELMVDFLDYILVVYLGMIDEKAYSYLSSFNIKRIAGYINTEPLSISDANIVLNKSKGLMEKEIMNDTEYQQERLAKHTGEKNIAIVYEIFKTLFDTSRVGISRISYHNSFPMYFNRSFDKKLIGRKEFNDSFSLGTEFFKNKLIDWNNNFDTHALDRLVSNKTFDTKDEWMRFLNDLLVITPSSYTERLFSNYREGRNGIIPEPGLDILTLYDATFYEERKICSEAIIDFLFNKELLIKNSLDEIHKKYALTFQWKHTLYIAFVMTKDEHQSLSDKEIFQLYWELYVNHKIDYATFNEDFWHILRNIHFNDKLEVREILKSNISENIDSFISNYSIEKLVNSEIYLLFTEYSMTGDSSATGTDIWKPNFISFLKSTPIQNDAIKAYIKNVEDSRNL